MIKIGIGVKGQKVVNEFKMEKATLDEIAKANLLLDEFKGFLLEKVKPKSITTEKDDN